MSTNIRIHLNTKKRTRKAFGMGANIPENGPLELSVSYMVMGTESLCFLFEVCQATLRELCLTIIY